MVPRIVTAAGLPEEFVRHRVATGAWTRLARGAYLTQPGPPTWLDRVTAAALSTNAVVSYTTAAALHGYDVAPPDDPVHLTVPRRAGRTQRRGIRLHFHDLLLEELQTVGGLLVTTPLRTSLDCARKLPSAGAVAALECAIRVGGVPAEVVAAAAPRRLVSLVEPRSESALETALRVLLTLAGFPPTDVQLPVLGYRVDLAYLPERVALEADGHAHHSNAVAFQRDRVRQNALVRAGWTVLRFTATDIYRRPASVIATVRSVLEVSGAGRPA